MYAMSEWECDHVDWNMIKSVQLSLQQRGNILSGRNLNCEANTMEDKDCKDNNYQNRPQSLQTSYPAQVLILPERHCLWRWT
jgi:hypothetical protein